MSTILVVDDMAICRETVSEALRQHGFKAICAADGAEALSILRENVPDLVLLDVNMPKMNGLTVLRTMRRNPDLKHLPVVLLTDRAERETVAQAAAGGVQGYLLKSQFSFDELLARVESCLGRVAVASATGADTKMRSVKQGLGDHRSMAQKRPTATTAAVRPAKPAALAGIGRVSNGPTGASANANSLATVRSIADLKPVITKSDLVRLVNDGLALRPLGATVHNVIAVTGNSGCCADDVAKAVSHDQALCIRLLKMANTSAYSRGRLVDSVKEAIQRIGIQEVRSLVMTLGVFDQFQGAAAKFVDSHLFWEHSIACGLMASSLAKACHVKNVDDYFLWGMLHDVGRVILLEYVSDQYASVWEAAETLGLPLEAVEARMMLLDHCDILERALQHWQFPRDFIAPVVNHHKSISTIERLGRAQSEGAFTVALANRLTHATLMGTSGNDVIYPLDDLVTKLNLSPSSIAEIVTKVREETNSLKFTMLAHTNEDSWPEFASVLKSRLELEFRPLCVSSEGEVDAYRMFCDRICVSSDDGPANLGVLWVRDTREFSALTEDFDAVEKTETGEQLPVVLITGKGKLDAEDPWLASRRHAVLAAPVRIDSFIATMQQMLA